MRFTRATRSRRMGVKSVCGRQWEVLLEIDLAAQGY